MFINRQAELAHLNQLYQSVSAHLYVLYGRRRVGKTELLRTFCEGKPHIFFVATTVPMLNNWRPFRKQSGAFYMVMLPLSLPFHRGKRHCKC